MTVLHRLANFFFPPKCLFCRKLLTDAETDLCHSCRADAPEFIKAKRSIPFLAGWTAVWYYNEKVRRSLLRYKFYNARSYAQIYGRFLAMKLLDRADEFDILTWVPISRLRRLRRGYDQVELLAQVVGRELGIKPIATLRKIRNTPPQSGIRDAAARRANVLGAYCAIAPEEFSGKRILLLDDVITTGATSSECARILLTAGAKEVFCAAIAAASQDKAKK
jgi:ComF family protein